jgi:hypothetical protein
MFPPEYWRQNENRTQIECQQKTIRKQNSSIGHRRANLVWDRERNAGPGPIEAGNLSGYDTNI